MALCSASCIEQTPRWTSSCSIVTRQGGIPYLVFFACNMKFNATVKSPVDGTNITIGAITDYTAWQAAVQHRLVSRTPEGIGEKPAATPTTERLSSCKPEAIANMTHTISFSSKDVDSANFTDWDYWNSICNNYDVYRLAWIGCDNTLYYSGDNSDPGYPFSITSIGNIIPQTNEESVSYGLELSFNERCIPKPIFIANLNDAFLVDVNT